MTDHTDERPMGTEDEPGADNEALESDRPSGWAGLTDALEDTENRPAGPDYGDSPLDDETPGSQGEIESGSEGDFGGPDKPASS
jgi:hypothetical protein